MENPGFGLTLTDSDPTTTSDATSAGPGTSTSAGPTSDPTVMTDASSDSSDATGSTSTTDDPGTSSTSDATTDDPPTTTDTTSTTDESTTADPTVEPTDVTSDTGESSTTGGITQVDLPLTISACVMLEGGPGEPYLGPDACEELASGIFGLPDGMILTDKAVTGNGGANREAWLYIRLDWPEELEGKQLLNLTLAMTVFEAQNYPGSDASGALYTTSQFDKNTLTMAPSDPLVLLHPDQGPIMPGQQRTWPLDPQMWEPGTALYLMMRTNSQSGSCYWSNEASDPNKHPYFAVTYDG